MEFTPIPAPIAGAINAVMANIKKLPKTEQNQHGRYAFASVDAFIAAVGPLCADAGLIIVANEAHADVTDKQLTLTFEFILAHKSGETWGFRPKRTVMVQALGAQAFGSAQSYALKQFMRSLFQIPTGDADDPDFQPAQELKPTAAVANTKSVTTAPENNQGDDEFDPAAFVRRFLLTVENTKVAAKIKALIENEGPNLDRLSDQDRESLMDVARARFKTLR